MDTGQLRRIFANYIRNFDDIIDKEKLKWQVAKRFKPMMDEALAADADELPGQLRKVQAMTGFLIDGQRRHPFRALAKSAATEPETVREMFLGLFSDVSDEGTVSKRIERFLSDSAALKSKTYHNQMFYDGIHSVTAYLAMYDPDHHFILMPQRSRFFADCVGFYDDWGRGDTARIDVYYRMCNQLVDAIRADEELMAADTRRFTGQYGISPDTLYPDPEKHILAFDLIYSCWTHGLYDGIHVSTLTAKERRHINRRRAEAARTITELISAVEQYKDVLPLLDNSDLELLSQYIQNLNGFISKAKSGKPVNINSLSNVPLQ